MVGPHNEHSKYFKKYLICLLRFTILRGFFEVKFPGKKNVNKTIQSQPIRRQEKLPHSKLPVFIAHVSEEREIGSLILAFMG